VDDYHKQALMAAFSRDRVRSVGDVMHTILSIPEFRNSARVGAPPRPLAGTKHPVMSSNAEHAVASAHASYSLSAAKPCSVGGPLPCQNGRKMLHSARAAPADPHAPGAPQRPAPSR
jgi:hypothetical protein